MKYLSHRHQRLWIFGNNCESVGVVAFGHSPAFTRPSHHLSRDISCDSTIDNLDTFVDADQSSSLFVSRQSGLRRLAYSIWWWECNEHHCHSTITASFLYLILYGCISWKLEWRPEGVSKCIPSMHGSWRRHFQSKAIYQLVLVGRCYYARHVWVLPEGPLAWIYPQFHSQHVFTKTLDTRSTSTIFNKVTSLPLFLFLSALPPPSINYHAHIG